MNHHKFPKTDKWKFSCSLHYLKTKEDILELTRHLPEYFKDRPVLYLEDLSDRFKQREKGNQIKKFKRDYSAYLNILIGDPRWESLNEFNQKLFFFMSNVEDTEKSLSEFKEMIDKFYNRLEKYKAPTGDMVGVIAAQSISEQFTQSVLNSFHSTGSRKAAAKQGIKRVTQLFDATRKLQMPYMRPLYKKVPLYKYLDKSFVNNNIITLKLKYKNDWDKLEYSDDLERIISYFDYDGNVTIKINVKSIGMNLKELLNKTVQDGDDFVEKKLEDLLESYKIDEMKKNEKASKYVIVFKLKNKNNWFKISSCPSIHKIIKFIDYDGESTVRIYSPKSFKEYYVKRRLFILLKKHVWGIKDVIEYDYEDNSVYFTPGTFIHKSFDMDDLIRIVPDANLRNLETNDIYFIESNFGIEAVKTYLLKEIRTVLGAEGMEVNYRHVSVLVDNMLVDGEIRGNKYTGLQLGDSVILKASFQEASSTFARAAGKRLTDRLTDVSSQIMLGQIPSLGTAYSHLVNKVVERPVITPLNITLPKSPEYAPISPEDNDEYDDIEYCPASPVIDDDEILMPDMDI